MPESLSNTLFLVPVPISEIGVNWSIPLSVIDQISKIQCFIVENAKTARHFLKQINPQVKFDELQMLELNKHNLNSQFEEIKKLLKSHSFTGLLSEAGMPCIADPGNYIVRMAHESGVKVKPLVGPSSILLALIASGLNGQQFRFNGYLPPKPEDRKRTILTLEKETGSSTQLFIEAPYRNDKLMDDLVNTLNPGTRLMVAIDITGENEYINCQTVKWWKSNRMEIGKIPCLFGIGV